MPRCETGLRAPQGRTMHLGPCHPTVIDQLNTKVHSNRLSSQQLSVERGAAWRLRRAPRIRPSTRHAHTDPQPHATRLVIEAVRAPPRNWKLSLDHPNKNSKEVMETAGERRRIAHTNLRTYWRRAPCGICREQPFGHTCVAHAHRRTSSCRAFREDSMACGHSDTGRCRGLESRSRHVP